MQYVRQEGTKQIRLQWPIRRAICLHLVSGFYLAINSFIKSFELNSSKPLDSWCLVQIYDKAVDDLPDYTFWNRNCLKLSL